MTYIAKPLLVGAVVGLVLCHLVFFSGPSTPGQSAEALQDEAALVQKDLNLKVRSLGLFRGDPQGAEVAEAEAFDKAATPPPNAVFDGDGTLDDTNEIEKNYTWMEKMRSREMVPTDVSRKFAEVYANTKLVRSKAHQTISKIGDNLNKAEEMIVVSFPSMDEVSEGLANESQSDKFDHVGGDVRRRRISMKEGTPDALKKRMAELPGKMEEQKANRAKTAERVTKIFQAAGKSVNSAVKEVGNQANDIVSDKVQQVGKAVSKWTTTTSEPTERLPTIFGKKSAGEEMEPEATEATEGKKEEDKSGSSRTSAALTLLSLLAVSYFSS